MSRVHLPHLSSLRIAGVGIWSLARLLSRHPTISSLFLDGLVLDEEDGVARVRDISLPQLHTIEGTEHQVAAVLGLLRPSPSMRLGNVVFRSDYLRTAPETEFNTESHLRSLRLILELRSYSLRFLSFDVPALRQFSAPFFTRDFDDGAVERALIVDMLDLDFMASSREEIREVLVRYRLLYHKQGLIWR